MELPRTYFPIYQTWKGTFDYNDGLVHLVEYEEGHSIFGQVRLRCGYYVRQGSCVWSTQTLPDCHECLQWFRAHWAQLKLPFPNTYSPRIDKEWHDPLKGYPSEEWISAVLSRAL